LDVHRLIQAGEELARAQREAIVGGGSDAFVTARREEAKLIRSLVEAAGKLLESAGRAPSDATLDRIDKTLRAAAATSGGREALKAGRLSEELEQPGFDAFADLTPRRAKRDRDGRDDQKQLQDRRRALRERASQAHEEARQQQAEADELEHQAREAQRALAKIRRMAGDARKRADRTAERARRIEEELAELGRR
jgi:chromosome segregation ATPase